MNITTIGTNDNHSTTTTTGNSNSNSNSNSEGGWGYSDENFEVKRDPGDGRLYVIL